MGGLVLLSSFFLRRHPKIAPLMSPFTVIKPRFHHSSGPTHSSNPPQKSIVSTKKYRFIMNIGELQVLSTYSVEMMEDREYGEAAKTLVEYTRIISSCALMPSPIGYKGPQVQATGSTRKGVSVYPSMPDLMSHLQSDDDDFFRYPFQVDYSPQLIESCDGQTSLSSYEHLSCSLANLFNLGLCHHLVWEKTKKKKKVDLLHKARQFYDEAMCLFSNYGKDQYCNSDKVLHLLMAICSNLAHCHYQIGNLEQGHLSNNRLKEVVYFASSEIQDESSFFYDCAYFNTFKITRAAAAA